MDWQRSDDAQPVAPVPTLVEPGSAPVPVTGAWRPGDDPGERSFARIGDLATEAGGAVRASIVRYNDEADVDRLLEVVAGLSRR